MIPIAKNIIVVDEKGNEYEATYPRRAYGLVKNGRARFVSENKICLACPPNIDLEDSKMDNRVFENDFEINEEQVQTVFAAPAPEAPPPLSGETVAPSITLDMILSQIDKIMADKQYILEAVNGIAKLDTIEPGVEVDARGEAIATVIQARETTNQKILSFLMLMYEDLRPPKPDADVLRLQQMVELARTFPDRRYDDIIKKSMQQMFVKAGAGIV